MPIQDGRMVWPITLWPSLWDREPRGRLVSWSALVGSMQRHRMAAQKDDLPLWSPCRYRPDTTRGRAGVAAMSMLVLDLDDLPPDGIELATQAWTDWPHVIHTTWSHSDAAPKARLILPLDEPIEVSEAEPWRWERVFSWASARDPQVSPDPACCDPSRMYYVPGSVGGSGITIVHDPGGYLLRLDPEQLPPSREERRREESAKLAAERRATRPALPHSGGARRREQNERLKTDPELRRSAAERLGARISGVGDREKAAGALCPQCGDRSIWWPIDPRGTPKALCNHRQSCGWMGWLDLLLESSGVLP